MSLSQYPDDPKHTHTHTHTHTQTHTQILIPGWEREKTQGMRMTHTHRRSQVWKMGWPEIYKCLWDFV